MKRIKIITLMIIMLILFLNIVSLAENENYNIAINGNSSVKLSEELELKLEIKDFPDSLEENGINVLIADITYDTEIFDSITVEGLSGFNATYNDESGKIVLDKGAKITANTEIVKIVLKLKEGIAAYQNTLIKLTNITLSNGEIDITKSDIEKSISIEENYMKGDANEDGSVTATDLSIMRRHLAGLEEVSETAKLALDINEDGKISATDLSKMRRHLAGLEDFNEVKDKEYNEDGTYMLKKANNVTVNAQNTILENGIIYGDLIISEEVGEGEVTLNNVEVIGNTYVRGGGPNSIIVKGASKLGEVLVEKIDGNVHLNIIAGSKVEFVFVDDGLPNVIFDGDITTLNMGEGSEVNLNSGVVKNLNAEADDLKLNITNNVSVYHLNANGDNMQIDNQGNIKEINAAGTGTVIKGNSAWATNGDVSQPNDILEVTPYKPYTEQNDFNMEKPDLRRENPMLRSEWWQTAYAAASIKIYVATNGEDYENLENNQGGENKPFKTISGALRAIPDFGACEVVVRDGEYGAWSVLEQEYKNWVWVHSENFGKAVFTADEVATASILGCRNIIFSGFDIRRTDGKKNPYVVELGASMPSVEMKTISQNIVFENCILHDSLNDDVFHMGGNSKNIELRTNLFYNAYGSDKGAFNLLDIDSCESILVEGNIFFNDYMASSSMMDDNFNGGGAYIKLYSSSTKDENASKNNIIRSNVFYNWAGRPEESYIQLGEKGAPLPHAKTVNTKIDGNLFMNNKTTAFESYVKAIAETDTYVTGNVFQKGVVTKETTILDISNNSLRDVSLPIIYNNNYTNNDEMWLMTNLEYILTPWSDGNFEANGVSYINGGWANIQNVRIDLFGIYGRSLKLGAYNSSIKVNPEPVYNPDEYVEPKAWTADSEVTNPVLAKKPYERPAKESDTVYEFGPGGGGRLIYPNINPLNDNNLFVSCDMTSSYVSVDGGANFDSKEFVGQTRYFFDENNANNIWATSGNYVYKSTDGGESWVISFPNKDDVYGLYMAEANGLGYAINGNGPDLTPKTPTANANVLCIYVEPNNSNIVYAVTQYPSVYKSTDGGETWNKWVDLPGGRIQQAKSSESSSGRFNAYATMIKGANNVYRILSNNGLYEINSNREISFANRPNFAGDMVQNGNELGVYIVQTINNQTKMPKRILKTTNWGNKWEDISEGILDLPGANSKTYRENGTHVGLFFISVSGSTIYVQAEQGVFKSSDDGKTWSLVLNLNSLSNVYHYNNSVGEVGNLTWEGTTQGIVVSKTNPNHILETGMGDVFESTDGGATWHGLSNDKFDENGNELGMDTKGGLDNSSGIVAAGQEDFDIDPFNPNHQIGVWTDIGVFETFDGGKSWDHRDEIQSNTTYAVAFDPFNEGVILISFVDKHEVGGASTYSTDTPPDPQSSHGGIYRSIDGGKTWDYSMQSGFSDYKSTKPLNSDYNNGLPYSAFIMSIEFDPNNNGVVYCAAKGAGVYKSTDSGSTWTNTMINTETTDGVRHIGMDGEHHNEYGVPYRFDIHGDLTWGDTWMTNKWEYDSTINPITGEIIKSNYRCIERNENMQVHDIVFSKDGSKLFALFVTDKSIVLQSEIHQRAGSVYYLDLNGDSPTTWKQLKLPYSTEYNLVGEVTVQSLDTDDKGNIYIATKLSLATWSRIQYTGESDNPLAEAARISDVDKGGAYVLTAEEQEKPISEQTWKALYSQTWTTWDNKEVTRSVIECDSIKCDSRNGYLYMVTDDGKVLYSKDGINSTYNSWKNVGGISKNDLPNTPYSGSNNGLEEFKESADMMPFTRPHYVFEAEEEGWIVVTTVCGGTWKMKVEGGN